MSSILFLCLFITKASMVVYYRAKDIKNNLQYFSAPIPSYLPIDKSFSLLIPLYLLVSSINSFYSHSKAYSILGHQALKRIQKIKIRDI